MSHWIIAPIVLPAMMAAVMVLLMRHHLVLQRTFSLASIVTLLAIALGLAYRAAGGAITVYDLGDWPAPFGIVVVGDRLSTLMVLLTSILALAVMLYTIGSGWDRRGRHFHPLFQFQLMGICGAFLTGDAFNLFVFFEVLLIASYGLMIHAGGTRAACAPGCSTSPTTCSARLCSCSRSARSTPSPGRSTWPTSPSGWRRCPRAIRL